MDHLSWSLISRKEIQLSKLKREFVVLLEVATALAQAVELDSLLNGVMNTLSVNLEEVDAGVVLLCDEESSDLRVRAVLGYRREPALQAHVKPGESISGSVFQSGKAEVYSTQHEIERAMATISPKNRALFDEATKELGRPQSAVALPLLIGERKLGVMLLQCFAKDGKRFQEENLSFFRALAGLIATAIDRVRLQDEAREVRALDEANRLKGELLSILAHEMRTPLASIKGYGTALLLEDTKWEPEKQREFLEIIDTECDNLSEIVRDLLESSIIDAGLLEIEKEPVLMPRLAQQAMRDIGRRTKIHRFLVTFPDDFPIVEADPERIRQVLHNILDNAVKYSPDGGLIVVRGEVGQSEVTISVADQGVGIAPEDLNRLFDKYFRVKSRSRRPVPGTGLGLPIAQTIVQKHGGRIWAESQLGKGTTLYFSLPFEQPEPEKGEPSDG